MAAGRLAFQTSSVVNRDTASTPTCPISHQSLVGPRSAMMDVEHLRLPPAVGTALADARNATDALLETDPLRENLQQRYGAAAVALQNWPPSREDWPGVPDKCDHVTRVPKKKEKFRAKRQAWWDAMKELHEIGWAGMSHADRQHRYYNKRQKQQHEAEQMDGGSPPPNTPLELCATRARSARRDSKGAGRRP